MRRGSVVSLGFKRFYLLYRRYKNQPTLGFGLELIDMSRIADIADQHIINDNDAIFQRRSFHMNGIAQWCRL